MGLETAALAGDVGNVDGLAVAQGRAVEEAEEGRQVTDEALSGDLLPEVVGHVGVEQPSRPGSPRIFWAGSRG